MTSVQDENGHWKRVPVRQARFKAVWLDNVAADGEGKRYGGPLAYILKYLAKNLTGRKNDGGEIGQDFEIGKGAVEGAELVRIWASLWGIRQFQAFGDASVSVWREARRLRDTPPKDQVLMAFAGRNRKRLARLPGAIQAGLFPSCARGCAGMQPLWRVARRSGQGLRPRIRRCHHPHQDMDH
ncbi:hypothetical protein FNU76_23970 [Chitinimonas arctica]|uniref:Uncharacterized protein n=1 Tax=Chitinimonas arctica TaxID=2594795 RepID=A0A516SLY0_9NEIS|nr:hypothetical protein [Chitinimonas arctica]QDQ29162.1 hypothetical protein FNU76_23970 [Chitinimonas arctica]